jgi:uncharacterized membrane protein (DUF2068 family)
MNSSPDCSPKSAEAAKPGGKPPAMAEDTQLIKRRPAATLIGIALFKLGKGLLFLAISLFIYTLSDNNLPREFLGIIGKLHLNPETKLVAKILQKLGHITEANMLWVAGGTVAYAVLAVVEGIGLLLRYTWAANLTIVESAVFVPVEVYELQHSFSTSMLCLLCLNVLIVIYLIQNRHRLFRHTHWHQKHREQAG